MVASGDKGLQGPGGLNLRCHLTDVAAFAAAKAFGLALEQVFCP